MENMIHGFSEQFLDELAEQFDLSIDTVIDIARICEKNGSPEDITAMVDEKSQELHDEDWFDEPDVCDFDDENQPDEMQEWHDFDPDC